LPEAEKNNSIPMRIEKLNPIEWALLAERAHLSVFDETRAKDMDRIDFALLMLNYEMLQGYITCRELDKESLYWQFGGAFPSAHSTIRSSLAYDEAIRWCKEQGYKRITTLVENENVRYLKMAMHYGFRIIGCRFFDGKILVELFNDLTKRVEK
jgi:RimJ/RimL family protein N-acetyltransferase